MLQVGQWVGREQLLAELVGTTGVDVIAYVREQARWRVRVGATGVFIPNDGVHEALDVRVTQVEDVGAKRLEHDLLASQYGGPLPVRNAQGRRDLRLAEGTYQVRLAVQGEPGIPDWRVRGRASIQAPAESLAGRFLQHAASVLIRESGF